MPFPWALAAAELMSVLGAAVGGGKKDPNTEYTAQEEELVNMQVESARRLLDLMKNRIGNENLYMPQALSAVFQNAQNQMNAPRNVVWGKHVFEPHLRPRDKVNFTIPTGNWDTKPNDPYPTDPPVPGVPGPPGPGGGGNGGAGSNGGNNTVGNPANMPPGLGWVSPGTIRTDEPSDGVTPGGNTPGMFYSPYGQRDEGNGLRNVAAAPPLFTSPYMGRDEGTGLANVAPSAPLFTSPYMGRDEGAGLANVAPSAPLFTSPYMGRDEGTGLANVAPAAPLFTSPYMGRDEGAGLANVAPPAAVFESPYANRREGTGNANLMPGVYTDPNAGRPEGGMGLANHLPNLRTGDEGQGYSPGGFTPSMVGPTFRTGQEGQGYSAANNPSTFRVPDLQAPVTDQGFDDRTFSERQGLSGVHSLGTDTMADPSPAMSAPPEVVQSLTSINALPQAEREDLIGSMGGLPEGLFLMPNGLLSMAGGQGVNGLVSAWLVQAVNRMSNPPPALAPLGGNGATAFNPDPAVRYGVGPDGRNDIGQRRNGKKG